MKHLGDITKISGYSAPVVDVVVGGSPCQDLSVAGKRAGLDGERSGLFMEQIRIIKEMREHDREVRGGNDVRPRYMVWENVPGAFSSNKGDDFRVVLEETAKVADKDASVPLPNGGKWSTSGCLMGDGWSIAWRVLDAQFWGVPQRRRRIALVADFGGQSAPEILFVRKGVSGDIEQSKPQRKEAASDTARGSGADDRLGADQYNAVVLGDTISTLGVNCGMSTGRRCVLESQAVYAIDQGGGKSGANNYEDVSPTLTCTHGGEPAIAYSIENHPADSRVNIDDSGKVQTLTSRMDTGGGNVPMVMQPTLYQNVVGSLCASDHKGVGSQYVDEDKSVVCYGSGVYEADTAKTLDALNCGYPGCNQGGIAIVEPRAVDCRNGTEDEVNGALQSNSAHSLNGNNVVRTRYIVRRLTPLECERLQGYPDNWTLIGKPTQKVVEEFDADTGEKEGEHIEQEFYYTNSQGKRVKCADAARYKALGNSIALPPWKWVMKRISACYEREATLASLFDGIGGFPYIWEQINGKGSCLWASEIEEFPIAVTKVRIGE